jgi:two-component system CheB/CheR fusion protein
MPYRTFEDKIDGLVITFINITESKKLEDALKGSQLMLHSLIETLPIGIIILSDHMTIIEFNGEAEELSGYKNSEATGENFFNLFLSEPSRNMSETELKKLGAGLVNRLKTNAKGINGKDLTIEWSAPVLQDGRGNLIGIMKVVSNEFTT